MQLGGGGMRDMEHKLARHNKQLEDMLKNAICELDRLRTRIEELEEENWEVSFRHGALLAELHLEQKARDDSSRN